MKLSKFLKRYHAVEYEDEARLYPRELARAVKDDECMGEATEATIFSFFVRAAVKYAKLSGLTHDYVDEWVREIMTYAFDSQLGIEYPSPAPKEARLYTVDNQHNIELRYRDTALVKQPNTAAGLKAILSWGKSHGYEVGLAVSK